MKECKYIFWYIGIILLFSIINWGLFCYNSTSFMISEQMNKHVNGVDYIEPDIDLATYHQGIKDEMPITVSGFAELIKPHFAQLDSLNCNIENRNNVILQCQVVLDSLSKIADEKRSDAAKAFKDSILKNDLVRIDSLIQYMEGRDSTEMILQHKYVELAEYSIIPPIFRTSA